MSESFSNLLDESLSTLDMQPGSSFLVLYLMLIILGNCTCWP